MNNIPERSRPSIISITGTTSRSSIVWLRMSCQSYTFFPRRCVVKEGTNALCNQIYKLETRHLQSEGDYVSDLKRMGVTRNQISVIHQREVSKWKKSKAKTKSKTPPSFLTVVQKNHEKHFRDQLFKTQTPLTRCLKVPIRSHENDQVIFKQFKRWMKEINRVLNCVISFVRRFDPAFLGATSSTAATTPCEWEERLMRFIGV